MKGKLPLTFIGLCVLCQVLLAEEARIFSFVHIADMHLHDDAWIQQQIEQGAKDGYRSSLSGPTKLREAVKWMREQERIAFIFIAGDSLEGATKAACETLVKIMDESGKPWLVSPGNHDYKIEALLPSDLSHGGVDYHFKFAGLNFVGIQSFNEPAMASIVSRDSMEKVAYFLETHKKEPVVMLTHMSFIDPKFTSWKPSWEVPYNTPQLYELFRKGGGVIAVLGGHLHEFRQNIDDDGIYYCLAPGFCDSTEFLVWNVYADRMAAEMFQLGKEGKVALVDGKRAEFKFPEWVRLKNGQDEKKISIKPLEKPQESLLDKWFGPEWIYAQGFALPASWREDAVLLQAKTPKKAVYYACEPGKLPPKDKNGREWFDPEYDVGEPKPPPQEDPVLKKALLVEPVENGAWFECTLPAAAFDPSKLKRGRAEYFFRIPFDVGEEQLAKIRRGVVKRRSYAGLAVYVNGRILPSGAGSQKSYDSYSIFQRDLLRASGNVVAASIRTAGWGGYELDIEVGVEY